MMLSVVLPTYNEAGNLRLVVHDVEHALIGIPHETIVVDDDSPDGTWRLAEELRLEHAAVRVMRRKNKHGLSSAAVDGFRIAKGDVLAVMDADGQHDAVLLKNLYQAVRGGAGIAIGSRYVPGGDVGQWDGGRHILSKIATQLALRVLRRRDAASVRDPMSGFFAIQRSLFLKLLPSLNPRGFKILLDLLFHVPEGTAIVEVPLRFGLRRSGRSKLSLRVQWEFLSSLYDATLGKVMSAGAVLFTALLVGIVGGLLPRLWALKPLYLDSRLRALTQQQLQRIAGEEGWLLSDVQLVGFPKDAALIVHRPRVAGGRTTTCYLLFIGEQQILCGIE